jgi:hypothetical protein
VQRKGGVCQLTVTRARGAEAATDRPSNLRDGGRRLGMDPGDLKTLLETGSAMDPQDGLN